MPAQNRKEQRPLTRLTDGLDHGTKDCRAAKAGAETSLVGVHHSANAHGNIFICPQWETVREILCAVALDFGAKAVRRDFRRTVVKRQNADNARQCTLIFVQLAYENKSVSTTVVSCFVVVATFLSADIVQRRWMIWRSV